MDVNNAFDRAIDARFRQDAFDVINAVTGKHQAAVRDAAVFAADTLDLAWLAAQAVFEAKAKPEHALAIYDRLMNLLEQMPASEGAAIAQNEQSGEPGKRLSVEDLLKQWQTRQGK